MIKPFGRQILIKPQEKEQVLVSEQGTLCEYGIVQAIGSQVKEIKVGDNLGFLVWGVNKLIVGEETFYFLLETDDFLLGTIE